MKTDDLISMLAREPQSLPVIEHGQRARAALAVAAGISFVWMATRLGLNAELSEDMALPMFWVKLGFVLSLAISFGYAMTRLGRPGQNAKPQFAAAGLFALVMFALGLGAAFNGERSETLGAIQGESVYDCPISIATLSVPLFIASFWAMRQFAPTQLTLAGAVAGLFSGAVAATVYSLHCTGYHATFIALWYSVGVAVPGIVGALLGRWLLRW
jgi:hypothetical protein